MVSQTALDILEIRLMIVSYLSSGDLTRCVYVSKQWQGAFEPLVYQHINFIKGPGCMNEASFEAVKRNRMFVETMITMDGPALVNSHLVFPQLTRLEFHPIPKRYKYQRRSSLATVTSIANMIAANPTITHLLIRNESYLDDGTPLWIAIARLSRLEHLFIRLPHVEADTNELLAFIDACDHAQSVHLDESYKKRSGKALSRIRPLNMSGTVYNGVYQALLTTTSSCLEYLTRPLRRLGNVEGHMANYKLLFNRLAAGGTVHLRTIILDGSDMSDEDMAGILDACAPNLEGFSANDSLFGPASFQALRRHIPTLKELGLDCIGISNAMRLEMVKSCPLLRHFERLYIRAVDMMKERPQARSSFPSLRRLSIRVDFPYGSDEMLVMLHQQALAQVGQLHLLEDLTLDLYGTHSLEQRLSLANFPGMERLSGLKQLKRLSLCMGNYFSSPNDIAWLIDQLPSLRYFHCDTVNTFTNMQDIVMRKGIEWF
ncbi:hypothetical protein EDD11_006646 [Mortierella claussenii]|nr:hypothetical protein EDD11_006646 [Mortierella claussenii]